MTQQAVIEVIRLLRERIALLEELAEYSAHDHWRCEYRTRYGSCMCGLDELRGKLGLPPVPPNDPEAPK